jgi:hypothetical protein
MKMGLQEAKRYENMRIHDLKNRVETLYETAKNDSFIMN